MPGKRKCSACKEESPCKKCKPSLACTIDKALDDPAIVKEQQELAAKTNNQWKMRCFSPLRLFTGREERKVTLNTLKDFGICFSRDSIIDLVKKIATEDKSNNGEALNETVQKIIGVVSNLQDLFITE